MRVRLVRLSRVRQRVVFQRSWDPGRLLIAPNLVRLPLALLIPDEPRRRTRFSPAFVVFGIVAGGMLRPSVLEAQQQDSLPQMGLGASSALTAYLGVGQIKHATLGSEVGAALDLGWLGTRRLRFSVGVDYLAMTIDRPDSLNVRERGAGYVFTAFADVNLIPSLARRVTPYGGVGFGVDAVGTTISNEQIGALYNTNEFDVHGQLGAFYRLTPHGRLSLEARVTGARVVRRLGVRLGYTWLYNGLP